MEEKQVKTLEKLLNGLRTGVSVHVKNVGGHKILRIDWLNIVFSSEVFQALAKLIAYDVGRRGFSFDAVASVETSGAKYGLALSYELKRPYFSIHKASKITFEEPVSLIERSVTEDRRVSLHLDRAVASKFKRVLLVDDIRRSSRTLNAAVELLNTCGAEVEACYVILDLAFAGNPPPAKIPSDRYLPLFVISAVEDDGRCEVSGGLVVEYLGMLSHV
jgi:adenine/guanine phosphoribosyltransferase-like PRPP-binding protein